MIIVLPVKSTEHPKTRSHLPLQIVFWAGWFSVLDTVSDNGFNGGYIAYFGLLTTGSSATTNRIAILLDREVPTSGPAEYYLVLVYGNRNSNWTKRIPISNEYNTWFFYAVTFNGRIGTPIMNDFNFS